MCRNIRGENLESVYELLRIEIEMREKLTTRHLWELGVALRDLSRLLSSSYQTSHNILGGILSLSTLLESSWRRVVEKKKIYRRVAVRASRVGTRASEA